MRTVMIVMSCVVVTSVAMAQTNVQPAPKAPDGKPDLTGVYQASPRRGGWDAEAPGDEPGVAAQRRPGDVAALTSDPIPFRPEARARAQELLNRRSIDDPASHCIFIASPRITGVGLFPVQIVQTPTQVVILYEYLWTHRVIPIGTKHPDDMSPSFMGDSVGHWEGSTFVVDVVGFKPGGWLTGGLVTSDALHLTERYTRVDRDQLTYEVTLDDPKVLTKPFTQRTTLMLREGARLREYSCPENNMDPAVYEKLLKDPATFQRTPGK
ncbi:MAG TPA: hypothetical protein VKB50_12040 [Vicinamibacterales bacterium]|nr:hypothetical protein [Vicinamibacterales bacterium]